MNWITNEMLFYGGLLTVSGSFILAILFFSITQIQKIRLNVRLDEEYGKKERKKK